MSDTVREAVEKCPTCSGDIKFIEEKGRFNAGCFDCGYEGPDRATKDEAILAHNEVCKLMPMIQPLSTVTVAMMMVDMKISHLKDTPSDRVREAVACEIVTQIGGMSHWQMDHAESVAEAKKIVVDILNQAHLKDTESVGDGRMLRALEELGNPFLELTSKLAEHPEGYDRPCLCELCRSYGD